MGGGATAPTAGKHKKLIEAGYQYVQRNQSGDDGLAEDSEYFNLPESYLKRHRDEHFTVHHEGKDAFQLFEFCQTQWRLHPATGSRIGLDYTAVIAIAGVMGCNDLQTLKFVRFIELGALTAYANRDVESMIYG